MANRGRTLYRYPSYNYGSTARAYSNSYDRQSNKRNKKAAVETIRVEEYSVAYRTALIAVMLLMAALAIVFLCLYGYNYKLSSEISELQTQLNELKEDNYYLESDFENNLNLDYIEEVAVNRLGMQKPSAYQIKYINVPKQSYTILYDTEDRDKSVLGYLKKLDIKSALKELLSA